jgi:hypothetical protein
MYECVLCGVGRSVSPMKEYYINVYQNKKTGFCWLGAAYRNKFDPVGNLKSSLIYRIHVKMKG